MYHMDSLTLVQTAKELLKELGTPETIHERALHDILKLAANGGIETNKEASGAPVVEPTIGEVKKSDGELQIVWTEVYAPGVIDTQGDFMQTDTIRNMAHHFLTEGRTKAVDVNHDRQEWKYDSAIVESFIARADDPTFYPGAWVVGVHIPDPELWALVDSGELNAVSLDAMAKSRKVMVKVKVDPEVKGETGQTNDHHHDFVVNFDGSGEFLGGYTSEVNGHRHVITNLTLTDEDDEVGHTHRWSVVGGPSA